MVPQFLLAWRFAEITANADWDRIEGDYLVTARFRKPLNKHHGHQKYFHGPELASKVVLLHEDGIQVRSSFLSPWPAAGEDCASLCDIFR